jgi:hypothetical protein
LFPIRNTLNEVCEVLRLGLEGTNPGISITPLVGIKKNLCIEALPFGYGKIGLFPFGWGGGSVSGGHVRIPGHSEQKPNKSILDFFFSC